MLGKASVKQKLMCGFKFINNRIVYFSCLKPLHLIVNQSSIYLFLKWSLESLELTDTINTSVALITYL